MTSKHFALAANLIVVHTALNLWLIAFEHDHPYWIGVQAVLTILTLGVVVRSYSQGGTQ